MDSEKERDGALYWHTAGDFTNSNSMQTGNSKRSTADVWLGLRNIQGNRKHAQSTNTLTPYYPHLPSANTSQLASNTIPEPQPDAPPVISLLTPSPESETERASKSRPSLRAVKELEEEEGEEPTQYREPSKSARPIRSPRNASQRPEAQFTEAPLRSDRARPADVYVRPLTREDSTVYQRPPMRQGAPHAAQHARRPPTATPHQHQFQLDQRSFAPDLPTSTYSFTRRTNQRKSPEALTQAGFNAPGSRPSEPEHHFHMHQAVYTTGDAVPIPGYKLSEVIEVRRPTVLPTPDPNRAYPESDAAAYGNFSGFLEYLKDHAHTQNVSSRAMPGVQQLRFRFPSPPGRPRKAHTPTDQQQASETIKEDEVIRHAPSQMFAAPQQALISGRTILPAVQPPKTPRTAGRPPVHPEAGSVRYDPNTMGTVTDPNPFKCPIEGCMYSTKGFRLKSFLDRHLRSKSRDAHRGDMKYGLPDHQLTCPVRDCKRFDEPFNYKGDRNGHITQRHPNLVTSNRTPISGVNVQEDGEGYVVWQPVTKGQDVREQAHSIHESRDGSLAVDQRSAEESIDVDAVEVSNTGEHPERVSQATDQSAIDFADQESDVDDEEADRLDQDRREVLDSFYDEVSDVDEQSAGPSSTGTRRFLCPFEDCLYHERPLSSKYRLDKHIEIKHDVARNAAKERKAYEETRCPIAGCVAQGQIFASKQSRDRHMDNFHPGYDFRKEMLDDAEEPDDSDDPLADLEKLLAADSGDDDSIVVGGGDEEKGLENQEQASPARTNHDQAGEVGKAGATRRATYIERRAAKRAGERGFKKQAKH